MMIIMTMMFSAVFVCCNIGGHTCICKAGFLWNGTACNDIDECLDGNNGGCHALANCTNTYGSRNCTCKVSSEHTNVYIRN